MRPWWLRPFGDGADEEKKNESKGEKKAQESGPAEPKAAQSPQKADSSADRKGPASPAPAATKPVTGRSLDDLELPPPPEVPAPKAPAPPNVAASKSTDSKTAAQTPPRPKSAEPIFPQVAAPPAVPKPAAKAGDSSVEALVEEAVAATENEGAKSSARGKGDTPAIAKPRSGPGLSPVELPPPPKKPAARVERPVAPAEKTATESPKSSGAETPPKTVSAKPPTLRPTPTESVRRPAVAKVETPEKQPHSLAQSKGSSEAADGKDAPGRRSPAAPLTPSVAGTDGSARTGAAPPSPQRPEAATPATATTKPEPKIQSGSAKEQPGTGAVQGRTEEKQPAAPAEERSPAPLTVAERQLKSPLSKPPAGQPVDVREAVVAGAASGAEKPAPSAEPASAGKTVASGEPASQTTASSAEPPKTEAPAPGAKAPETKAPKAEAQKQKAAGDAPAADERPLRLIIASPEEAKAKKPARAKASGPQPPPPPTKAPTSKPLGSLHPDRVGERPSPPAESKPPTEKPVVEDPAAAGAPETRLGSGKASRGGEKETLSKAPKARAEGALRRPNDAEEKGGTTAKKADAKDTPAPRSPLAPTSRDRDDRPATPEEPADRKSIGSLNPSTSKTEPAAADADEPRRARKVDSASDEKKERRGPRPVKESSGKDAPKKAEKNETDKKTEKKGDAEKERGTKRGKKERKDAPPALRLAKPPADSGTEDEDEGKSRAEFTRPPRRRTRSRRGEAAEEAAAAAEESRQQTVSAQEAEIEEEGDGILSTSREIYVAMPSDRAPSASDERTIALFCDLENIALGVRDAADVKKFDIGMVLERLADKGKVIVKKAYCDWERYSDFKRAFHEAAIEMIDIPQKYYSGKNSADIKMVVDALDLCYAKEHVDTFVIASGDSDFSPLVSKLRENNKYVIGLGVSGSSSSLLMDNCDEFIFYEDIWRDREKAPQLDGLETKQQKVFGMMNDAIKALVRENKDVLWGSMIKQTMQRKKPSFNEGYYGYNTFSELLEDAAKRGIIKLKKDQRSGSYIVTGFGNRR